MDIYLGYDCLFAEKIVLFFFFRYDKMLNLINDSIISNSNQVPHSLIYELLHHYHWFFSIYL